MSINAEKLCKELNDFLCNEEGVYNRELSKNIKMDCSEHSMHHLNRNLLLLGGTGSGKTKWIEMEIRRGENSYIIFDYRGEIYRAVQADLKRMNYNVLLVSEKDLFKDVNVEEMRAGVNYDGKTKTAVFCAVSSFEDVLKCIEKCKHNNDDNKKFPIEVTLILDEFAYIPAAEGFSKSLSLMKNNGFDAIVSVQALEHLEYLYPEEYDVIVNNCDVIIFFGNASHKTNCILTKIFKELFVNDLIQMKRDECMIKIRGKRAVFDKKV